MAIHVGQRIRYWRELRELTQAEVADRAKIDPPRLCRIELGKTEARAAEVERLAKAMDLTMPEFYGGLDEAKAS